MKNLLCTFFGAIGSGIAYMLGGWDSALKTLTIFMCADIGSAIIIAVVFKKSPKTENGRLESNAMFKGLCRKCMVFLYILIANRLDITLNTDIIRNAVIIGFTANELISIVENAGLMGIPLPKILINAIDILKKKEDESSVK